MEAISARFDKPWRGGETAPRRQHVRRHRARDRQPQGKIRRRSSQGDDLDCPPGLRRRARAPGPRARPDPEGLLLAQPRVGSAAAINRGDRLERSNVRGSARRAPSSPGRSERPSSWRAIGASPDRFVGAPRSGYCRSPGPLTRPCCSSSRRCSGSSAASHCKTPGGWPNSVPAARDRRTDGLEFEP